MGLDITAISNIIKSEDGDIQISDNHGFEYQLGSLKNGYYSETKKSKIFTFRAGSYSGYNDWRRSLAQLAGYSSPQEVWNSFFNELDHLKLLESRKMKLKKLGSIVESKNLKLKPFYELIFFSDCEGVIGPEISKKLYEDFVKFDKKAKTHSTDQFYNFFYKSYENWTKAFKIASKNGVVLFG